MIIYQILNKVNNKSYIGSTQNTKLRLDYHKTILRKNKHENTYLQNSWNKYREENFEFNIIATAISVTRDELYEIELDYVHKLYTLYPNGYNRTSPLNKPPSRKGTTITPEHKQKIREWNVERWSDEKNKENQSNQSKEFWSSEKGKELKQKRKNTPSALKGKTFEERYGEEKAKEIKEKLKLSSYSKGSIPWNKGKTFEELFGEEKAKELKEKISKTTKKAIQKEEVVEKLKLSNTTYSKGSIPWNKGKTGVYTEDTKNRISNSLKITNSLKKINKLNEGELNGKNINTK